MSNTKEWTTPNENDEIDVPDELMPLFNQIGTQIRLHTISGKNEVLTVAHCVRNAQKFFQSRISELEAENKRLREEIEAQQVEIVKKDEQLDNHRWIPVTGTLPEVLHVRIKLSDGSEINALTQNDGDFYWELLHRFIPEYAVTHFIPQPPKEQ